MTLTPPTADPRTTRHSTRRVLRARQLREDGWSPRQIRLILAKEFDLPQPPSKTTIRQWTEPGFVEMERRQRAEARARQRRGRPGRFLTDELLLALRLEDGLPYTTIAKVARRFYAVDLDPDQLRHRLNRLGAPKNEKKARAQRRRAAA